MGSLVGEPSLSDLMIRRCVGPTSISIFRRLSSQVVIV